MGELVEEILLCIFPDSRDARDRDAGEVIDKQPVSLDWLQNSWEKHLVNYIINLVGSQNRDFIATIFNGAVAPINAISILI